MAKIVLICGPQAVGKMTVGQELMKITNLRLMHNHMTIEPLLQIFGGKTKEFQKLNKSFRIQIFEEVAKSEMEGLIFTFIWAFDFKEDWDFVNNLFRIFRDNGGEAYIVELESDINERLIRNRTENRLKNKESKKNIEFSEKELIESMNKYRMNSNENEIKEENYIRINNTNISAKDVAKMIKDKFNL